MTEEIGFVKSSRDFLVRIEGLPTAKLNDLVESESGIRGWVSALYPEEIEVLLIDEGDVRPGTKFKKLPQSLSIKVGDFLIGRVVNPLGEQIDGKPLGEKKVADMSLEKVAVGISGREVITNQLTTGVTMIDTLIPLGKGQRELILGDARSGKTNFVMDIIINQKHTGMICVYALIGKSVAEVKGLIDLLRKNGAMDYTTVVVASSADPTPQIFLAPKTAMTLAEYFQSTGKDVLLILDDMGSHAKIYREISLLGGRSPGRESYPGDIFYQHAHLLERAGNFINGASISALPVIELDLNDFSTLIPTNLMAMTDGHLLFRAAISNRGQRPAIDISLSVSRVGRQTQNHLQDLLSTKIRQVLAQASQYETISRFSFELPPETKQILNWRDLISEMLKQQPLTFISPETQVVMMGLIFTSFYKNKDVLFLQQSRDKVREWLEKDPQLKKIPNEAFKMENEEELFKKLEEIVPRLTELVGDHGST
ncbi:MAG: F0F1 ATP synthase subunit alpha [Patescibacteria group bacterium]